MNINVSSSVSTAFSPSVASTTTVKSIDGYSPSPILLSFLNNKHNDHNNDNNENNGNKNENDKNNTNNTNNKNNENNENNENNMKDRENISKTPIFIGFGSMVIENPKGLLQVLLQGAALANVRVIVQAGWSDISEEEFKNIAKEAEKQARLALLVDQEEEDEEEEAEEAEDAEEEEEGQKVYKGVKGEGEGDGERGDGESIESSASASHPAYHPLPPLIPTCPPVPPPPNPPSYPTSTSTRNPPSKASKPSTWTASKDALLIGACPHSWLFERVAAVVHHGGAGTTAAGLRAGKPTWICPFFGDQFFWGEMIRKGGLGPSPCSIRLLTLHIVAESLVALTDPKVSICSAFATDPPYHPLPPLTPICPPVHPPPTNPTSNPPSYPSFFLFFCCIYIVFILYLVPFLLTFQ